MFLHEYSDLFTNDPEPPIDCYDDDTYSKMTQQMLDLYRAYKQSEDGFNEKIRLCKRYNNYIQNELPGYTLFITGSTLNGFGLKNSDVDLVMIKSRKSNSIESAKYILEEVLTCLRKYGISGRLIPSNVVPIIKFEDNETNLNVDISYNNVDAIRNTQLLYRYSKVDCRVRPLCVILKLWTKHRGNNDASSGTLSNYAWMLLMIHYLQAGVQPAVLPRLSIDQTDDVLTCINFFTKNDIKDRSISTSVNIDSIGKLFAGFLNYYREFECNRYVISIREGKKLPIRPYRKNEVKSCHTNSYKIDKYLFIEDPFTLNNLAITVQNLPNFRKIKRSGLRTAYKKLLEKQFNLSSILKI